MTLVNGGAKATAAQGHWNTQVNSGHLLNFRKWLKTDLQSLEIDFCSNLNTGHSVVHAGLPVVTLRRHCPHSGAHSEQTFEKGSGFLTPAEAFLTHLRCCT